MKSGPDLETVYSLMLGDRSGNRFCSAGMSHAMMAIKTVLWELRGGTPNSNSLVVLAKRKDVSSKNDA